MGLSSLILRFVPQQFFFFTKNNCYVVNWSVSTHFVSPKCVLVSQETISCNAETRRKLMARTLNITDCWSLIENSIENSYSLSLAFRCEENDKTPTSLEPRKTALPRPRQIVPSWSDSAPIQRLLQRPFLTKCCYHTFNLQNSKVPQHHGSISPRQGWTLFEHYGLPGD